MAPLRVLYLVAARGIPSHGPSGASLHVRSISAALAALGHRVELVVVQEQDQRGRLEAPQVPCSSAGTAGWPSWWPAQHMRELRTARRVARLAQRRARAMGGVDLIIERHHLYSDAGLRLSRRLEVPLVLEVNAPQVLERSRFEGPLEQEVAQRWERRVLGQAPHIVAVSAWLRDWLIREQGCAPDRVQHLPNGVRPHSAERQVARQALGLEAQDFVLGFAGSYRPWHGTDTLLALLRRIPDAKLLMVGADQRGASLPWDPGSLPAALRQRILSTGRLPQEQVAPMVAAMDLGLAPYPAQAPPWFCPLKILEYRAQGTPVVATDVGDCRLLTGSGGSVVPPGDLDTLTQACESWRGQRCTPHTRSWTTVAEELLASALSQPPVGKATKRR